MGIRFCFVVLTIVVVGVSGQSVKSSVEFYDTVANKKLSEIGSTGSASGSTFFIEESGTKRLVISKDTVAIDGQIKANSFVGNGSKLTGVTIDSISWEKIKNIPAGFADGVDNSGVVSVDSVKRAAIADSSKLAGAVSWNNIKDIPAGFADGIDNAGAASVDSVRAAMIADSCKKMPVHIKVDSARVAVLADSVKKIADGSITAAKFAPSLKIQADS